MPLRWEAIMRFFRSAGAFFQRTGVLVRAAAWATLLGILETVGSERGRRVLAIVALTAATGGFLALKPVRAIAPGEVGVRVNRLTGGVSTLHEGWAWAVPVVHELRLFPLRDQIYRPVRSARADGAAPFQT
jgi:hypothetical protein